MSDPAAYGAQTTTDELLDGVDLTGRRALVTGSSAGLGAETARALAAHGATVIMAVRDLDKGGRAADAIRAHAPSALLDLRQLDLASLASVRACADELLAEASPLHIVIANGGIMACPLGTTADGFEMQFGTNHVGHFVLVNRLVPLLLAGTAALLRCCPCWCESWSVIQRYHSWQQAASRAAGPRPRRYPPQQSAFECWRKRGGCVCVSGEPRVFCGISHSSHRSDSAVFSASRSGSSVSCQCSQMTSLPRARRTAVNVSIIVPRPLRGSNRPRKRMFLRPSRNSGKGWASGVKRALSMPFGMTVYSNGKYGIRDWIHGSETTMRPSRRAMDGRIKGESTSNSRFPEKTE